MRNQWATLLSFSVKSQKYSNMLLRNGVVGRFESIVIFTLLKHFVAVVNDDLFTGLLFLVGGV